MANCECMKDAAPITKGIEDKFYYHIAEGCIQCGACAEACPVKAIEETDGKLAVNPKMCIDCGTCSSVCPTGCAERVPFVRRGITVSDIDMSKCYFNPGCSIHIYKPDVAEAMYKMLLDNFGEVKFHKICCHNDPQLPEGSTLINNCAGCDRRFRSLYSGVETISFWEVIDSIENLKLPDYGGVKMTVHDSCGYRHKPQVHAAVRSLLRKMNIEVEEARFHGTESVCCGDNLYGYTPNERVQEAIEMRSQQFPCDDVVVYCIGCDRAMTEAGKLPHYLPDLVCGKMPEKNTDTLDEYHGKVVEYIKEH